MATDPRDEEQPGLEDKRLQDELTHPLRAAIYAELQRRPAPPAELAKVLKRPLSVVRYHYGVLHKVGGIPTEDASGA